VYIDMYACVCVCIYVYMYVCMCMYVLCMCYFCIMYVCANSYVTMYFCMYVLRVGADKSLARPNSPCRRTESIMSLESGVSSCAELQRFSCYRG